MRAVANSLAAVEAGARLVQGTINGYGERCGNANLVSIVPTLQLKMGHDCLPSLPGLTEAAPLPDELLNFVPDPERADVLAAQRDDVRLLRDDADQRGWTGEAARHQRVADALDTHLRHLDRRARHEPGS